MEQDKQQLEEQSGIGVALAVGEQNGIGAAWAVGRGAERNRSGMGSRMSGVAKEWCGQEDWSGIGAGPAAASGVERKSGTGSRWRSGVA